MGGRFLSRARSLFNLWFYKGPGRQSAVNPVGLGVINTSSISLVNPFMADSPSFTLIGDTTGGPPETSTWTRNGVTISDGSSYSISLTVPGVTSSYTPDLRTVNQIFQQSRYRSTLTVTGNLPGVYVHSVINRAMSAPRTANFTIEGHNRRSSAGTYN